MTSPWQKILDSPKDSHLVQFYGWDQNLLTSNVSKYLHEGLKHGEGGIVIATPEHIEAFSKLMGDSRDRVMWLDAEQTLSRFMRNGMPVWHLFEEVVPPAVQQVRTEFDGVRAYGEMVGLLWTQGRHLAAIRLEQFWNRFLTHSAFQLYCGYPIDIFGADFDPARLDALLCNHTHIVPAGGPKMEAAICRAMEEVAGSKAENAEADMKNERFRARWGILPRSEGLILWTRQNLPSRADEILERAKAYCLAA
jgi:hypothetical protein